jgi:RNA polymerase sigma-70 factor (ECF subfamily)
MIASISSFDTVESSPPATRRVATSSQTAVLDAELVRRFNTGDDNAFTEIVARYRGKMFSIALGLLRNHADAEEIAQDTFIRAHRGLARFRGDSSLATWLHRIALNLSRNRYWYFFRRHRHATRSLDCPLSESSTATFADLVAATAPDPVREATNHEFSSLVSECMLRLNPRQREILTLRNIRNQSYEEIASTLGLSLGTVKSRIARARDTLRSLLAESYPELTPDTSPFKWFETVRPSGHLDVICV